MTDLERRVSELLDRVEAYDEALAVELSEVLWSDGARSLLERVERLEAVMGVRQDPRRHVTLLS